MTRNEVPSDHEVASVLAELGLRVGARLLCDKLVAAGHPLKKSQLAIQRAAERGVILINSDWTLSVAHEAIAA